MVITPKVLDKALKVDSTILEMFNESICSLNCCTDCKKRKVSLMLCRWRYSKDNPFYCTTKNKWNLQLHSVCSKDHYKKLKKNFEVTFYPLSQKDIFYLQATTNF